MESPSGSDSFIYDAFLSYRQREPEQTWTRDVLLPRLVLAGIRTCIDHRDFRLGAPLVKEIARSIVQSRYTVAVLTPAYLDSTFTDLESVLAEHLGVELSQRRLLCIMREMCTPRIGLRARLWLDMTRDETFESDVQRLLRTLHESPDL